jgi:hypothetical protein
MGFRLLDQYSLLHAAVGVVAYYWSLPFLVAIAIHTVYEYVENTATGITLIQKYGGIYWPGGKHEPDALVNIVGDTLVFSVGWLSAFVLDAYGIKKGWYFPKGA